MIRRLDKKIGKNAFNKNLTKNDLFNLSDVSLFSIPFSPKSMLIFVSLIAKYLILTVFLSVNTYFIV